MTAMDLAVARAYYQKREARKRTQYEAERQQWLDRTRIAVLHLARRYPEIRQVYLFGSLLHPGRFRPDSDIDIAVACDSMVVESAFWRELERELKRDVDLRPLKGIITEIVTGQGEAVYGR